MIVLPEACSSARVFFQKGGGRGIQTGKRFIRQEQIGIVEQCAGDGHALGHAAGEGFHGVASTGFQAELIEQIQRPVAGFLTL